jgi:hypothetical protein
VARRFPDPERLERRIYFYRLIDPRGTNIPFQFNVDSVLDELRVIAASAGRYDEQGERVTLCIPDAQATRPRLRVLNVRRTNLPQMESAGVLAPLPLESTAGIADQIHIVFFPSNVIGSEFNFYGPRVTRLADFMRAKRIQPRTRIVPLFRDDAIRQLDGMREIRMAHLKLTRGAIGLLRRYDETLAQALDQTAEITGGANVEITVRRTPRSHESLSGRLRQAFRGLAADPEAKELVKALQIEGRNEDGEFNVVDLIKEELGAVRDVRRVQVRERALDSADAYRVIEETYEDLADEIARAGTLDSGGE